MPHDLVLPETDYPSTANTGVRRPGDISKLESKLSHLYGESTEEVRQRFYRSLRTLALASGAIERFPEQLADRLLAM
jgi:TatD DNase family protein